MQMTRPGKLGRVIFLAIDPIGPNWVAKVHEQDPLL
jgi:hypothetical protein